jgi:hypothetical protein
MLNASPTVANDFMQSNVRECAHSAHEYTMLTPVELWCKLATTAG